MPLARSLTDEFDAGARRRGEAYARDGHVRLREVKAMRLAADVSGSSQYHVEAVRHNGRIRAACTCPYFRQYGPCKHLYATLLVAEADGRFEMAGARSILKLNGSGDVHDDAEREYNGEAEDPDDEAEGSGEDEPTAPLRSRAPRAPAVRTPAGHRPAPRSHVRPAPVPMPAWRQLLEATRFATPETGAGEDDMELGYAIDVDVSVTGGALVVAILRRKRDRRGAWGSFASYAPKRSYLGEHEGPDAALLALLDVSEADTGPGYGYRGPSGTSQRTVAAKAIDLVLPALARTGRCVVLTHVPGDEPDASVADPRPLAYEGDRPWRFRLGLEAADGGAYRMTGSLERDGERMGVRDPALVLSGGWMIARGAATRLAPQEASVMLQRLRGDDPVVVRAEHLDEFLSTVHALNTPIELDLPKECAVEERRVAPVPCARIRKPEHRGDAETLDLDFSFAYEETRVSALDPRPRIYAESRRIYPRDREAELAASSALLEIGVKPLSQQHLAADGRTHGFATRLLPRVVRALVQRGWRVEADGVAYRSAASLDVEVTSGVDWFDVEGAARFDDVVVPLPTILAALRAGQNVVRLGDGSFGVLPETWMKRWGLVAKLGTRSDDGVRFARAQVGMLDVLLDGLPDIHCDEVFARVRRELANFDGIAPRDPPAGFRGELRSYQREGLGWMAFLERFGFGGCLADDMGLGKTVQALAALEAHRALPADGTDGAAPRRGLSLVVAPRSVIFNWKVEAARFAPQLRLLDHTGAARARDATGFAGTDLVLTTYGTLRRDAEFLKGVPFDYVVLDEAQAIKNASTETAMAVRLLDGRHRLALSGTPIENHIGELWSLFEFLNPGMLGASRAFATASARRGLDAEARGVLAAALKPFILRRTKDQVARDLPPKIEETIWCELEGEQRKQYDKLREFYRSALLEKVVDDQSLGRARMQVLEALLRLRQAACHLSLLGSSAKIGASAKFEALLPQLGEIVDGGHKALVFSQFTKLLGLLRSELDSRSLTYEYLDGRTRDRQARVDRFQSDPECRLFLISLKAGGLGLNLTAADYVFLLDPWWNPAVEAQAIDRTHRIGQSKSVFAYRLVARDTVEEKIIELQRAKRDLADAILGSDASVMSTLTRQDLEMLLE